jgi:hypothetical protein
LDVNKCISSQVTEAHACNPSYSGGRGHLEAILGQIVNETLSEKYPTQQSSGGDIKHEAPSSSSSQYCTKKERKKCTSRGMEDEEE